MSLHQCADKQLIDRWQQERDTLAFTILDNRHRPQLTDYVRDHLDGYAKNSADDIVQAVFENLLTTKTVFLDNLSVGPWLVTVADRRMADFHREQRAKKRDAGRTVSFSTLLGPREYAAEEPHGRNDSVPLELLDHNSPEKLACQNEQESIAQRMFRQLPGRQCEVMQLYGIQGLSIDETAEALGIDRESVKTHIRRAREKLMGMHELHQLTGDSAEEPSPERESTRAAGRSALQNLPKICLILFALTGAVADNCNLDDLCMDSVSAEADEDEVCRDDGGSHHDYDKQRRKSLMRLPLRPVAAVACRPVLGQEHPSVRARQAERREASTRLLDFGPPRNDRRDGGGVLLFRTAQSPRSPSEVPRDTPLEAA